MYNRHITPDAEKPVAPPQWDVGVFEITDAGTCVGLLWVTNSGSRVPATEYWGLGPSYIWPSSTDTTKTYKYTYTTVYGNMTVATFKSTCDTLFGVNKTTYVKATTTTF